MRNTCWQEIVPRDYVLAGLMLSTLRPKRLRSLPSYFLLLSLAKYEVVRVDEKSGSEAAALQIATSQYYAGIQQGEASKETRREWGLSGPTRKVTKHAGGASGHPELWPPLGTTLRPTLICCAKYRNRISWGVGSV